MTEAQLRQEAWPAYSKVVEYQRRGLVHVHVLARLDRAMHKSRADEILPPAPRFTADLFERAFRAAAAAVSAPADVGDGRVRWGEMLDIRQLATGEERGELAGYLAKYSTKSTELAGGLLRRVSADDVTRARVREHVRTYMATGFVLDAIAAAQRKREAIHEPQAAPDVESDWNPAAIVRSVRDEPRRAGPSPPARWDGAARIDRAAARRGRPIRH